jgi:hypothetical protein
VPSAQKYVNEVRELSSQAPSAEAEYHAPAAPADRENIGQRLLRRLLGRRSR